MSRVIQTLRDTGADVLEDVKDIEIEDFKKLQGLTDTIITETWDNAIQSMSFGFTFASAMAWNEAIKMYMKKHLKTETPNSYFLYALGVTFMTTLFLFLTKGLGRKSVVRPGDIKKAIVA